MSSQDHCTWITIGQVQNFRFINKNTSDVAYLLYIRTEKKINEIYSSGLFKMNNEKFKSNLNQKHFRGNAFIRKLYRVLKKSQDLKFLK